MKVTEATIKETLTLLKLTYPNAFKDISKDEALLMIKIWKRDFENDEEEIFKQAIDRLRYKCKYIPSIAEIKSEIATLNVKELQLNAESEWELVLTAIRKWGRLDNVAFEEITQNTIRAIGIHRLETIETSQVPFIKKEFIEIWNNKKDGIEKTFVNQNVLNYQEKKMLETKYEDKVLDVKALLKEVE